MQQSLWHSPEQKWEARVWRRASETHSRLRLVSVYQKRMLNGDSVSVELKSAGDEKANEEEKLK